MVKRARKALLEPAVPENRSHPRTVCIVGTRPGVGKTVVGGALADHARRRGMRVGVFKPIATGCRRTRHGLRAADAEFLAHWADTSNDLAAVNPICYRARLIVAECARREGRPVDEDAIEAARQQVSAQADVVLIEGVGSLFEPIAAHRRFIDMIREWETPIVLVSPADADDIHSTLGAIELARQAGLNVWAVVLNRYRPHEATLAEEMNPETIARYGGVDLPVVVPADRNTSVRKCWLGADVRFALSDLGNRIVDNVQPTTGKAT